MNDLMKEYQQKRTELLKKYKAGDARHIPHVRDRTIVEMYDEFIGAFYKLSERKTTTEAKEITNEKALHIGSVISRFIFDESDDLGMQCNEIAITIDPCHADDKDVDIVIYNDNWNELKRIKTPNGL